MLQMTSSFSLCDRRRMETLPNASEWKSNARKAIHGAYPICRGNGVKSAAYAPDEYRGVALVRHLNDVWKMIGWCAEWAAVDYQREFAKGRNSLVERELLWPVEIICFDRK